MIGRKGLAIAVVFVLAITLRLTPYLVFNEPFSTDVWPLIRISQKLVSNSEAKIWDDKLFDGYNNRWPGVSVASAVVSEATGLSVELTYVFLLLSATILAYGLFAYLVLERFGYGATGAVFLLFFPPMLIFTSSLLKEVYAYPFLYALLFLVSRRKLGWAEVFLVPLLSFALTVTHHLASVFLLGFLISYVAYGLAFKHLGLGRSGLGRTVYYMLAFHAAIFSAYFLLYGSGGLKISYFGFWDLVGFSEYWFFVFITSLLLLSRGFSRVLRFPTYALALVLSFTPAFLPLVPGVGTLGFEYLLYIAPLAPVLAYAVFSSEGFVKGGGLVYVLALLQPIIAASLFVFLGRVELFSILHRILLYITFPLSIYLSYFSRRNSLAGFVSAAVVLFFGVLVFSHLLIVGDSVSFYWKYGLGEVSGFKEALFLTDSGCSVLGDAKLHYFSEMIRNVDSTGLFTGECRGCCVVVVYRDNLRFGWVVGALNVLGGVSGKVGGLSRVLDNGLVYCFAEAY